jgi:hypothetical protein
LQNNTTGSSNTASGFQSGSVIADGTTPLSVANYCTYLGAYTQAATNGAINETVLGAQTTGHGSNTVTAGNSSVTDTYLAGTVHGNSFVNSTNSATAAMMSNGSTQTLTSGTYTPTLTALGGTTSVTLNQAMFTRVNNIVHVNISIEVIQSSTTSNFYIQLPVNTTNIGQYEIGAITASTTSSYGSVWMGTTTQTMVALTTPAVGTYYINIQFDYSTQ